MLRHSRRDRNSLRAGSNRVRGVLDIGTRHDRAAGQQQGAADVEFRVWAWWEKRVVSKGQRMCLFCLAKTESSVQPVSKQASVRIVGVYYIISWPQE